MPLGRQPRRARGTLEHPDSAIGLRIVLAAFGVIVSVVGYVLLLNVGYTVVAYIFLAIAVTALVDLIVVTTRWRSKR